VKLGKVSITPSSVQQSAKTTRLTSYN